MSEMPVWERRFRAPKMALPRWSRSAPDRTVFASNESGVWQVHCWNVATGERRRSEERRVGKECRSRWQLDPQKKKEQVHLFPPLPAYRFRQITNGTVIREE